MAIHFFDGEGARVTDEEVIGDHGRVPLERVASVRTDRARMRRRTRILILLVAAVAVGTMLVLFGAGRPPLYNVALVATALLLPILLVHQYTGVRVLIETVEGKRLRVCTVRARLADRIRKAVEEAQAMRDETREPDPPEAPRGDPTAQPWVPR